jgi:hypothetical protein
VHGVAPLDDANARYLQVMSALARSPSLVDRVVRAANVPGLTAARLHESSRVTPEADSDALDFTVTSASPATATRLANIYASEYVQFRNERTLKTISEALRQVRAKIASLPRTAAARPILERDAKRLSQLAKLATRTLLVLEPPSATTPVRRHELRNGIIGGLLGLLVGTALLLGLFRRFPGLRPP